MDASVLDSYARNNVLADARFWNPVKVELWQEASRGKRIPNLW